MIMSERLEIHGIAVPIIRIIVWSTSIYQSSIKLRPGNWFELYASAYHFYPGRYFDNGLTHFRVSRAQKEITSQTD